MITGYSDPEFEQALQELVESAPGLVLGIIVHFVYLFCVSVSSSLIIVLVILESCYACMTRST